jgi:hypothetical protein
MSVVLEINTQTNVALCPSRYSLISKVFSAVFSIPAVVVAPAPMSIATLPLPFT